MIFDFENPSCSYLLGVIHGNGCINFRQNGNGRVLIRGGRADSAYIETLRAEFRRTQVATTVEMDRLGHWKVACNSTALANELKPYKVDGIWALPPDIRKADWVAGVFDTDGYVARRWLDITQLNNGNLENARSSMLDLGFLNPKLAAYDDRNARLKVLWRHDLLLFRNMIPLRHPRKITELAQMSRMKTESLGHGETDFFYLRFITTHPNSSSQEIERALSALLGRDLGAHAWQTLWKLERQGKIKHIGRRTAYRWTVTCPTSQLVTQDRGVM